MTTQTGTCTCGRSPTGNCIGWHNLTEEQLIKKLFEYIKKLEEEKK